jgi:hypothetical protein
MEERNRTNTGGKAVENKILLAMSDAEFNVIRPHLEYVSLPSHLRLHEPHQTMRYVHFPNEGLISLVVVMGNGKTVEAGIVGREGIAGFPSVAGLNRSPLREVMQIGGNGFRVKIRELKKRWNPLRGCSGCWTVTRRSSGCMWRKRRLAIVCMTLITDLRAGC